MPDFCIHKKTPGGSIPPGVFHFPPHLAVFLSHIFTSSLLPDIPSFPLFVFPSSLFQRKINRQACLFFAFGPDIAAELLDDTLGDRQSQPDTMLMAGAGMA